MINIVLNKISFRENRRRYINLRGIASGRYAYKGPDVVQIDLTDKCNSKCLVCWIHSPFITQEPINTDTLDSAVVKDFIKEVAAAGTKEIIFSGGGEPLFFPEIWEILEFTEKTGLSFRINTNFTLLSQKDILKLASFKKLISLTVSIWASDAAMFSKIHNREPQVFHRIKDNLKFLNKIKPGNLNVTIYANINNVNYFCLKDLMNLALETGCGAIEFGVPDVIPQKTDAFLLNKEQLGVIKQEFIDICRTRNKDFPGIKIANENIFLRRISSLKACEGEYNSFIEKIPCYAGWLFLRLRANGDFNSCLKSHRIPIGNIYKNSFSSVWNSPVQQKFRQSSVASCKDIEYFRLIGNGNGTGIGCRRLCDNILVNEHYTRVLKYFFWLNPR